MTRALAPEHRRDLANSGLGAEVIEALQFESVRPQDIEVRGAKSAYRIPYFTIEGTRNCFERWRLFPVIQRPDGSKQKYHQPAGTDPNLYLPLLLSWKTVICQTASPILIVEGEKKAASGCAKGLFAIGVGGLWNWRQRLDTGEPLVIPTIDLFQWVSREVLLVPDSDAWREGRELDLLAGFYTLGQELISRGSSVRLLRLPESDGIKQGLDDWLVSVGSEWEHLWVHLERIGLDDECLKKVAAWWQDWRSKQVELEASRTRTADIPEMENIGDVFSFRWSEHHVQAILERLTEKAGCLKGELSIERQAGTETQRLVSHTNFNLSALQTRRSIAKALAKTAHTIPWERLLEVMCQQTIEAYRQGEPLVIVGPDTKVTPVRERLHPLVHEGVPTVLYGPGGQGKSFLAQYFAFVVAHGGFHGLFCGIQGSVLYLDYETDQDVFIDRSVKLRNGHAEFASTQLLYQRCHTPLAFDLPLIQRRVAEGGVKLVVVDSVAPACGGELERPESAIQLFSSLRKLRISSLLIAHTQKNSEDKTPFGTVFFTNYLRSVWELQKVQEVDEPCIKLALHQRKHNLGALHASIGLQLSFQGDAVSVEPLNLLHEPQLKSKLSLVSRLKHALRQGPKTVKQLAGELEADEAQVRARLNEGIGKWSQKLDDERWALLDVKK